MVICQKKKKRISQKHATGGYNSTIVTSTQTKTHASHCNQISHHIKQNPTLITVTHRTIPFKYISRGTFSIFAWKKHSLILPYSLTFFAFGFDSNIFCHFVDPRAKACTTACANKNLSTTCFSKIDRQQRDRLSRNCVKLEQ